MKKLLLISDLHGQQRALTYLQQIIDEEEPDGVIASGDITTAGDISYFDLLEDMINKNGIAGYIIWGNSDVPYANTYIRKSKLCIHLKEKKLGKFSIFGLAETDDPIDISDKIGGKILVTHRPPQKELLKRKYMNAPIVHISGHLHTQKSAIQYPSTFHISVPTLQNGDYAIFYPDTKRVEFSHIS